MKFLFFYKVIEPFHSFAPKTRNFSIVLKSELDRGKYWIVANCTNYIIRTESY